MNYKQVGSRKETSCDISRSLNLLNSGRADQEWPEHLGVGGQALPQAVGKWAGQCIQRANGQSAALKGSLSRGKWTPECWTWIRGGGGYSEQEPWEAKWVGGQHRGLATIQAVGKISPERPVKFSVLERETGAMLGLGFAGPGFLPSFQTEN